MALPSTAALSAYRTADDTIQLTVSSPTNIAVIKYWGKADARLNTPINSSVSVTINQRDLRTTTTVTASKSFERDRLWLNGVEEDAASNKRVQAVLAAVRSRAGDAVDGVFTTAAVLETGNGRRVGLDEIRTAMQGLHRYEATDHQVGASTFAIDGDRATGTVECEAHHWSTNDSGHRTDPVMTITYHDRYEQTPAGWRLTHRRLDIHRIDEVDADGLRTR